MREARGSKVLLAASLIAGWVALGVVLASWARATADHGDRSVLGGRP